MENRLPLRKACLVNHDAYPKFSDSDPKKCGLALRTARSHARSSWYYLNAFQQPFNTKYIFVPKHLKNISLSGESAVIEVRFRTPRSRSHGAEAQHCASSVYCGLCDNNSAPNHFNLTFLWPLYLKSIFYLAGIKIPTDLGLEILFKLRKGHIALQLTLIRATLPNSLWERSLS